jgi:hypothetical protein
MYLHISLGEKVVAQYTFPFSSEFSTALSLCMANGNFEASPAQPILGDVKIMPRLTSIYGLRYIVLHSSLSPCANGRVLGASNPELQWS